MQTQNQLAPHVSHYLSTLPTHPSFPNWLLQFRPLLTHLSLTHSQMILSQSIYSLVHYSNQISLKYFALIDYLIHTYSSFTTTFESVIQPIFVKTYVWLHHNKRIGDCQQMRLMRGRWVGKFGNGVLHGIKMGIWNWIGVDVDKEGFNGYGLTMRVPKMENVNITEVSTGKRKAEDSHYYPIEKRRTFQPNPDTNSTDSNSTPIPTKVSSILSQLQSIAPHRCKLCGIRFSSRLSLQSHQKQEMKDKIQKYKEKKFQIANKSPQVIIRQVCLSSNKWIDPNPLEKVQEQFYFYLRDYGYEEKRCEFCLEEFQLRMVGEEWVFRNCCKVEMEGRDCPMHKKCYDLLSGKDDKEEEEKTTQ